MDDWLDTSGWESDWSSWGGGEDSSWLEQVFGDDSGWDTSSSGGWGETIKNLFGSSSGQGGGSDWGNVFAAMLGGLGGSADAKLQLEMAERVARIEGEESRKTIGFQADLVDYYKQKEKNRKRTALDTYGQFSLLDRWAPNYVAAPPIDQPNKPGV